MKALVLLSVMLYGASASAAEYGVIVDLTAPAKLEMMAAAIRDLASASSAGDSFFMITLSNESTLERPLTQNREALEKAITKLAPADGSAPVLDAIAVSLECFGDAPGTKSLVVLSGGRAGASKSLASKVSDDLKRRGAKLHVIFFDASPLPSLVKLAKSSRGKARTVRTTTDSLAAMTDVAAAR